MTPSKTRIRPRAPLDDERDDFDAMSFKIIGQCTGAASQEPCEAQAQALAAGYATQAPQLRQGPDEFQEG
jgi:hypothetical protein